MSHEDGSTDFSDDDTVIEDRVRLYSLVYYQLNLYIRYFHWQNGSLTPEKKNRSRPPSYTGGESPITNRSRSSTCDSLQLGSSPNSNRQMPPPPLPQGRKPGLFFINLWLCNNVVMKRVELLTLTCWEIRWRWHHLASISNTIERKVSFYLHWPFKLSTYNFVLNLSYNWRDAYITTMNTKYCLCFWLNFVPELQLSLWTIYSFQLQ